MALPPDAIGWTVVCDSGISWPYSLTVLLLKPPSDFYAAVSILARRLMDG